MLVLGLALFAGYAAFLSDVFEAPGNLLAAGVGALCAMALFGAAGNWWHGRRDAAAFRRAIRGVAPRDGSLTVVSGPIRPLGAPLSAPFSGRACVAYEYDVLPRAGGETVAHDLTGVAMTPSVVEAAHGGVRLLGFPLLDEFPRTERADSAWRERAERYVAETTFEPMQGLRVVKLLAMLEDALADADGAVRKDCRLAADPVPLGDRVLRERVVEVGQQVCAIGLYRADLRALTPTGATLNRLVPGDAAGARGRLTGQAEAHALFGLVFFLVGHAILGGAWYLSETRHAREPAERQASVVWIAVQEGDVAALERAVRRGADPSALDVFGGAALHSTRDPAMVAALIRLGADVNVRRRESGETPLIVAARGGNAAIVRLLLGAGADVHLPGHDGTTALAEAVRVGADDVVALLRSAGAVEGETPVEAGTARPAPVERER